MDEPAVMAVRAMVLGPVLRIGIALGAAEDVVPELPELAAQRGVR